MELLSVLIVVCLCIPHFTCGSSVPVRRDPASVTYNETGGSNRFPDEASIAVEDYKYFISDVNFEAIPGKLLVGAADTLYLLNSDLSLDTALNLPTSTSNIDTCTTTERPDNPGFACHNHIRVYQRVSDQDTLLVCGTHAGVEPRCFGVGISGDGLLVSVGDGVVAPDGIISYYPEFSQFGEFRNDTRSDPVYLTAGFFPGDSGAGRHFSISYKNITVTTPSDPSTLATADLFQTINANNNWLRFPVVFVGSERADYSPSSSPTQRDADYQFWFIFLRERVVTDDTIHSQLARVCRNDLGSTLTASGARYFSTIMKARIQCERSKPPTFDSIHTLDYQYNSITSFVFSQEGRYYNDGSPPNRLLYGSFTGPGNGPLGSAICAYPADNSVETSAGAGRTKSVFDIFREDIVSNVDSTPVENFFLECDPAGRPDDDQQLLFINPDVSVKQIGDDPIFILDNDIITQMVQDTVCAVARDSSSMCVNQDVLFLGLDSGHVMKVVFGTDENGDSEPVIVEDIEFDDDNPITKMAKQVESDLLYVNTWSKVYSLPLHRCTRFTTCSECVGSRDPYCVWSDESLECIQSPLTATDGASQGTVDSSLYFQNIHTGSSPGCNYPEIGFVAVNMSESEGAGSVGIDISSSAAGSVELFLQSGTATDGDDYQGLSQVIVFSAASTVTVSVMIIGDSTVEGDEWFIGRLRGTANAGVILTTDTINVTITDDDNVDISFSQMSYSVSEGSSLVTVTINKVGSTNFVTSVTLQSSDKTASDGDDYFRQDLVLTFETTSTSMDVVIPLINDDVMEGEETFTLCLVLLDGAEGVRLGSPSTTTVNITDDDVVTVSLSPSSYVVYEEDGSVTVQLVKSGETQLPVEVLLSTVDGTASAPGDFVGVTDDIITFSADQTVLTAAVVLVDDVIAEEEESLFVSLSSSSQGVRVGEGDATITVRDRDSVILRLEKTNYTWNEGAGEVSVVIELIGINERVVSTTLQVNPMTASEGLDYSLPNDLQVQFSPGETNKEVTLVIVDDMELEQSEVFLLTLNSGPGATYDNNSLASVVITDDDQVVVEFDMERCALVVTEGVGSLEITISRDGLSSIPVEVLVQIQNGTATENSDFSAEADSLLLTIPPSPSSSVSLVVVILDDSVVEMREEHFSLSLSSSQTGVSVADNDTTTISITDDDSVVVSFAESGLTVVEEVGVVNITLLLSGLHSVPVSVFVETQALTANGGEDYEPVIESVTFDPGVLSRSLLVAIVDDGVREEPEEFQVITTADGTAVIAGLPSEIAVQIIDTDTIEIGFSSGSYSVSEGVGFVRVSVEITGQTDSDFAADISTWIGTAIASEDYQSFQRELIFDSTSVELTVVIVDDDVREEEEEFRVQITLDPLKSPAVRVGENATTIIQIADDDSVSVMWGATSYTVSESQSVLELVLLIEGSTSFNFTLLVSTYNGSATGGLDYVAVSSHHLEVSPSLPLLIVTLGLLDDEEVESTEQLTVTLQSAEGERVEIDRPETEVFIISDDVLQVEFLNASYTVMEGERADLIIVSTVTAPFDIAVSASLQQQETEDHLFILQNTLIIPTGSSNTSLHLYTLPSTENGNDTAVYVVLELGDETDPSVELGTNRRVYVTIVSVDICSMNTDSAQPHTSTASLLHTPSPPPSIPPSPVEPEVAGSRRESSNCLYPSKQLAIAITVVLALLVCLLLSGCALFLLCLRYCHSSYDSKKASEMCELPPIEGTEKGALNLSLDDVTSFTDSQPATSMSSLVKESVNSVPSTTGHGGGGKGEHSYL